MVQLGFNLINRCRRFLFWLWKQEGTPAQRARGISVGIFCGCFPLFGAQTILGIILASAFRANRLLAVAGTWISNPFTYIPLYWFNYKVGSLFIGNSNHLSNFKQVNGQELWRQGWFFSSRILLGSTIVGFIFGLLTGLIIYFFLKKSSKIFY